MIASHAGSAHKLRITAIMLNDVERHINWDAVLLFGGEEREGEAYSKPLITYQSRNPSQYHA